MKTLTVWGWVALLLVLWLVTKFQLGNQIFRYVLIVLIIVLILMNYKQLVNTSTS